MPVLYKKSAWVKVVLSDAIHLSVNCLKKKKQLLKTLFLPKEHQNCYQLEISCV